MRSIKIGTRNSPLAMWQAREVARNLQNLNYTTDIVPVLATGDKNLNQPLYKLGITGIFTKDLDLALLNNEIDIAVHSLKDIPTELPENIEIIAVLERDYPQDVLVRKKDAQNLELHDLKIATSSLRRRAFWSKEFPDTQFSDIRGNVQTRLNKLEENDFDATMFSLAAIERNFLNTLEGGCTAPIGAFAEINDKNEVRFIGRLCSLDGKNCIETDEIFEWNEHENFGKMLAQKVLENGGRELMNQIKREI